MPSWGLTNSMHAGQLGEVSGSQILAHTLSGYTFCPSCPTPMFWVSWKLSCHLVGLREMRGNRIKIKKVPAKIGGKKEKKRQKKKIKKKKKKKKTPQPSLHGTHL